MRQAFWIALTCAACWSAGPGLAWGQDGAAPESAWKTQVVAALNFTQASFSNWAAGGENSMAWQASVNGHFKYDQAGYELDNKARLVFGLTRVGDEGTRKAADEIRLESVYTRKMAQYLNPFFGATAQTQLASGYNYGTTPKTEISGLLDPGYFTQTAGVGYRPNESFVTRLGASIKETVTRDHPVPYADDPGTPAIEKTRSEVGITATTELTRKLSENLVYAGQLVLFSNLKGGDQIDVNWENSITAKVARFVNVTFTFDLVYDKDVTDDAQVKQTLAMGLTYNLF